MISSQLAAGVYRYRLPPFSSSMKYMLWALSNPMPSCETRGITLRWTSCAGSPVGSFDADAVNGLVSSKRRPYGLVHGAGEHQDSSAVTYVPHGVQKEASKEMWAPGAGLCQMVSASRVSRFVRWMPDWPVSNGENRKRCCCDPVSFEVIMSQAPLLKCPSASWVVRSASEAWSNSELPKVMGIDSSAVTPAEDGSGVKSEKRVGLAPAGLPATSDARASAPIAAAAKGLYLMGPP